MYKLIRVAVLGACVVATALTAGCLIVPVHDHRCGYHHCW